LEAIGACKMDCLVDNKVIIEAFEFYNK